MSAPRPTQFIALRRLAVGARQSRQLHMTGPATSFLSPMTMAERPASNLPRDIAGLRAECKRRKIDFAGSKQDLMSRINADDLTHSRAFSTAVNAAKRPTTSRQEEPASNPVRYFNTSRTLKANNDTSTIDFAFLPDFDPDVAVSTLRVPILPDNSSARTNTFVEESPDSLVMRPEVSSMAADSTFSPMAEVHDNTAMPIDFHAVADRVAMVAKKVKAPVVEQSGALKQLWNGMVDDIRGSNSKPKA